MLQVAIDYSSSHLSFTRIAHFTQTSASAPGGGGRRLTGSGWGRAKPECVSHTLYKLTVAVERGGVPLLWQTVEVLTDGAKRKHRIQITARESSLIMSEGNVTGFPAPRFCVHTKKTVLFNWFFSHFVLFYGVWTVLFSVWLLPFYGWSQRTKFT